MPKRLPTSVVRAREKVKKLQSQLKKAERELSKRIAKEQKKAATHVRMHKKTVKKQQRKKVSRPANKMSATKKPASTAQAMVDNAVQIGDQAPLFTALTDENQTFVLEDCQGQYVVLYFYPKDNTPGCTQEAHDFTDTLDLFTAKGTLVVGVSRDSVKSHAKFKQQHGIDYTLLADVDESICQCYGVMKNKTLYGKVVRGIERSTFLIGPQGRIECLWRGVKVPGHVGAVLEKINELIPKAV